MLSIEERLAALEESNDELKFKLHAAKVAITTLSVFADGIGNTPQGLSSSFEEGMKSPHWQTFATEEDRIYHEKLVKEVLSLLADGKE
ncbi:hypothetical protein [Serratia liquefaciens]|uniref:hypothetical protein n=1 Tax=Serratia liquefaciens TaxID=614 RepID=UPI00382FE56A